MSAVYITMSLLLDMYNVHLIRLTWYASNNYDLYLYKPWTDLAMVLSIRHKTAHIFIYKKYGNRLAKYNAFLLVLLWWTTLHLDKTSC